MTHGGGSPPRLPRAQGGVQRFACARGLPLLQHDLTSHHHALLYEKVVSRPTRLAFSPSA